MKITSLSAQVRNPDRVNISVDGKFRLSLDIYQVGELGIKIGKDISEDELAAIETESSFGKLYARALEYCLMRPHSAREVRDYLYRKTLTTKYKTKKGEIKERQGYSPTLTTRVLQKLQQKNYVNDEKFARWWIETRHQNQGSSLRKLRSELAAKGVSSNIIEGVISQMDRTDDDEITKMIAKKRQKYTDEHKLMQYLVRQGFSYQQVRDALDKN